MGTKFIEYKQKLLDENIKNMRIYCLLNILCEIVSNQFQYCQWHLVETQWRSHK